MVTPTVALIDYASQNCEEIGLTRPIKIHQLPLYKCVLLLGTHYYSYRLVVEEKCAQGRDPIVLVFGDYVCGSPVEVRHPTDQDRDQCYDFTTAFRSAKTLCGEATDEIAERDFQFCCVFS